MGGNQASNLYRAEYEKCEKNVLLYCKVAKQYEKDGNQQAAFEYYIGAIRLIQHFNQIDEETEYEAKYLKMMSMIGQHAKKLQETHNLVNPNKFEMKDVVKPIFEHSSEEYEMNLKQRIEAAKNIIKMQEAEILEKVINAIMFTRPSAKMEDIVGCKEEKELLTETIQSLTAESYKMLVRKKLVEKNCGALLFGPPGCCKTVMMHACVGLAGEQVTVFQVSGGDLKQKYFGESEKFAEGLYQMAHELRPSIILMDEAEELLKDRTKMKDNDPNRGVVTNLMSWMTAVEDVVTIASTNKPGMIESAIMRRLQTVIYIKLPSIEDRKELIKHFLKPLYHTILPMDIDLIARLTEGFSGDDLRNLFAKGKSRALKLSNESQYFNVCESLETSYAYPVGEHSQGAFPKEEISNALFVPRPFTMLDVAYALNCVFPTTKAEDMIEIERFDSERKKNSGEKPVNITDIMKK